MADDSTREVTGWIARNWHFILGMFSILLIGVRNEVTTQRLSKTVYSEAGDLRLVRVADCNLCRTGCQDELKNELKEMRGDIKMLIRMHLNDNGKQKT